MRNRFVGLLLSLAALASAPALAHCGEADAPASAPAATEGGVETGAPRPDSGGDDASPAPPDASIDTSDDALPPRVPQVLVAELASLGSDGTTAYVFHGPTGGPNTLEQIGPTGTLTPILQRTTGFGLIAVNASSVVLGDSGGIVRVARSDAAQQPLLDTPANLLGLGTSGSTAWALRFTGDPGQQELLALTLEGGATLATPVQTSTQHVAVDADGALYVDLGGNIRRMTTGGGGPTTLITGSQAAKAAFLVDGATLYVARLTPQGSEIVSYPAAGGTPTILGAAAAPPGNLNHASIATDATTIYFTNGGYGGPVFALGKAPGSKVQAFYVPTDPKEVVTQLAIDANSLLATTVIGGGIAKHAVLRFSK